MNILEICSEPPSHSSGIGRSVLVESEGLRDLGHEVEVLHPKLRLGEFKFSRIPARRYSEHDIIHVHGPTPLLSDITLVSNFGLPLVYTHYAEVCFSSEPISRGYTRIHRGLAAKSSRVIVWTHEYARLFRTGATVIRPPISFEASEKPPQKRDRFTAVYVGQLRPFKGIEVLIRAAQRLPEVDFWIVGDGWYRDALTKRASGCGNVSFLGAVYDDTKLASIYEQAHLLLLPSINTTEAYGLVAIEGAVFGCVPIASDLLGVRENLAQLDGFPFAIGSDDELARIIRRFQSDPGLWRQASERSRQRANAYARIHTIEAYAREHLEVFRHAA